MACSMDVTQSACGDRHWWMCACAACVVLTPGLPLPALPAAAQEEIAEMKAAEAAREKLVGDVVRENKRLAQPLAQVGWGEVNYHMRKGPCVRRRADSSNRW